MKALLSFEWNRYFLKIGFWSVALLWVGLGIFIGFKLSLRPGPMVFKDAPYSIANMIGFLSLICIFIVTPLAAKNLFREKDHHFSLILYATPMSRFAYLASRFLGVFGLSLVCFLMLVLGFAVGQQLDPDRTAYAGFHLPHYLQPLLILALPNLLFCSAVVCSVGWLSKNKLLVYISGLFLYIAYMVLLLFSGSPMMAGALPPSPEAMDWSAKLDPFGLSAFYDQTNAWSVAQRNSEWLALEGNLLLNRLIYFAFSLAILSIAYRLFRFTANEKVRKRNETKTDLQPFNRLLKPLDTQTENGRYHLQALRSFVSLDLRFVVKSIPFLLIAIGLVFFMSMEIYTSIDQGIRIPEQYATTGLMVNRIVSNCQGLVLMVLLFYAYELLWRSTNSRFALIENATPVSTFIAVLAKWFSLTIVIILFSLLMIALGVFFQILYSYPIIEWKTFAEAFLLSCAPLVISAGMILTVQSLVKSKWPALLVSVVVILLTATSLGKFIGVESPLLRFQSAFGGRYSDMNGWGDYLNSYGWKMLYGFCATTLLFVVVTQWRNHKRRWMVFAFLLLCGGLISGVHILKNYDPTDEEAQLQIRQQYEQRFRRFGHLPQPSITHIETTVDLFPEDNAYSVSGTYTMQNKTAQPIRQILINFDPTFTIQKAVLQTGSEQHRINQPTTEILLQKPLLPGQKASFRFSMRYRWSGFKGHQSFNAIVQNGSFLRISNYYPRFGYQPDYEISDTFERTKRKLGDPTPLLPLETAQSTPDDFVQLKMTISTDRKQTAIGIGELQKQWTNNGRNYFLYQTPGPVAFRFAVSSAEYAVKKVDHRGKTIAVYFHPDHFENVARLIQNAKYTLDYCSENFGGYPFDEIRFAEISSFTQGFAATAYPTVIFMPENVIFHANIKGDKQQDVINELAGHELSHQWWGANQLTTDEREGSKFLTETLAMYTELMLVKKMYGRERTLDNVRLHLDLYRNTRGFTEEQPLYKTVPDNIHQHYSKGLVTMYQLSEMIGEAKVNLALKRFLAKYKYPNGRAVSTDLLAEFYAVSDISQQSKIDDLFRWITVYEFAKPVTKTVKIGSKYRTKIYFKANKIYEDGKGKQTFVPLRDSVEIALRFSDGKQEIRKVYVAKNEANAVLFTNSKPVEFTFDPNEKMIKTGSSNSHKFK